MWTAKTDEEAGFIYSLQTDREAAEPMLEYARWLGERGRPREAEFLRLALDADEDRLMSLRRESDLRWLDAVTRRWFRRGDVVQVRGGTFQGFRARVVGVDAPGGRCEVVPNIFYRPAGPIWVAFSDLRLIERAGEVDSQD